MAIAATPAALAATAQCDVSFDAMLDEISSQYPRERKPSIVT
jgi:hypothetical protein